MAKKIKKKPIEFNGTPLTQEMADNSFIQEYMEWETFCRGVSGDTLKVKNIASLFDMLNEHITTDNVRDGSPNNPDGVGEKANNGLRLIKNISDIMKKPAFTVGDVATIQELISDLEEMKNSSLDPALIHFTEYRRNRKGEKVGEPIDVYGHYRTENYVKNMKRKGKEDGLGGAVDGKWLTGNNPPHQALFSEGASQFAKPRGLLGILQDAEESLKGTVLNFSLTENKIDEKIAQINQISSVRDYFDNVVNTQGYWRKGQGKLMPSNIKREIAGFDFSELSRKDQDIIREVGGLGKRTDDNAIYGTVESFKMNPSIGAIVRFVNAALKRKGETDGYYRAPDGFIAWQSAISGGFDYRKTRKEVNPERYKDTSSASANSKVVSKSWIDILRG